MNRVLVIGHSHLLALYDAYSKSAETRALFDGIEVEFVSVRDGRYKPEIRRGGLNPNLKTVLAAFGKDDVVLASIGGNAHNACGSTNFDPPFDFYLPGETQCPVAESAELLPAGLVRKALERVADRHLRLLQLICAGTHAKVFQIEPPPPPPSKALEETDAKLFKERIARYGVAPTSLRYKLWRLHSELFKAACDESGAVFVAAPRETQDDAGLLRTEYWSRDGFHGNERYGSLVMRQFHGHYRDLHIKRGNSHGATSL